MYVRDVPGVINICVSSRYSFTLCICCVITQRIATIIPHLTNYELIVCTIICFAIAHHINIMHHVYHL